MKCKTHSHERNRFGAFSNTCRPVHDQSMRNCPRAFMLIHLHNRPRRTRCAPSEGKHGAAHSCYLCRMLHVTAVTALCCRCLCCLCSRDTNASGTSTDWYQLADCTVDLASKICVTGSSVSSITRESEPQHFRRSHQPLSIHFSRVLCERLFSFVDDCCIYDSLRAG